MQEADRLAAACEPVAEGEPAWRAAVAAERAAIEVAR
jgi:hypothetical protein